MAQIEQLILIFLFLIWSIGFFYLFIYFFKFDFGAEIILMGGRVNVKSSATFIEGSKMVADRAALLYRFDVF